MLGGTPQITARAVVAVPALLDDAPGGSAFLSIPAAKACWRSGSKLWMRSTPRSLKRSRSPAGRWPKPPFHHPGS